MVAASDQPSGYAEGGVVSALPTVQDLSNPTFDWSSMGQLNPNISATSFTPMTQNAPISAVQGPAFGSMGTDVYDWKAPTAQAAPLPYSILNSQVAQAYNRRLPTEYITSGTAGTMVTPAAGTTSPGVTQSTGTTTTGSTDPYETRRQEAAQALSDMKAREEVARQAQQAEAARIAQERAAELARAEQTARAAQAQAAAQAAAQAQQAQQQQQQAQAQAQQQAQASSNPWAQTVNDIYQQEFGRQADPSGMATFTDELNKGMTGEQMRVYLRTSPEGIERGLSPAPAPAPAYVNPEGGSGASWYAGDGG